MYCDCKMQFQIDGTKCARALFVLKYDLFHVFTCFTPFNEFKIAWTRLNKKFLKSLRSRTSNPRARVQLIKNINKYVIFKLQVNWDTEFISK